MTEQPLAAPPSTTPSAGWIDRGVAWSADVLRRMELSSAAISANLVSSTLWRRLGAAVADGIVLYIVFRLLNALRFNTEAGPQNLAILVKDRDFWISTISPIHSLLSLKPLAMIFLGDIHFAPFDGSMPWLLFSPVLAMLIVWLYHAVMESSAWQATLGKRLCGVIVTGLKGDRISFFRASARTFAKSVAWLPHFCLYALTEYSTLPHVAGLLKLPSLIGVLIAVAARRQQALHDGIADTLVVRAGAPRATVVETTAETNADMKQCPACAEWIRKEAKKCRYCQERLEG